VSLVRFALRMIRGSSLKKLSGVALAIAMVMGCDRDAACVEQVTRPGCSLDPRTKCADPPDPDCTQLACRCDGVSFLRCENPTAQFRSFGPCEADQNCMNLDETQCTANALCAPVMGDTEEQYCARNESTWPMFVGCRGAATECGLAITFAKDPKTERTLVFPHRCVPLGWQTLQYRRCANQP
jgi:hypothetical protein